jgi:hypothetical protein
VAGVGKVVGAVALVELGGFFKVALEGGEVDRVDPAVVGDHVFAELDVVKVGVAPVEVGLAVIVDLYCRVDGAVGDGRLADGVFYGPAMLSLTPTPISIDEPPLRVMGDRGRQGVRDQLRGCEDWGE